MIINNISNYQRLTQKEVVVFNVPGKTLIALTSGRETIWLTTDIKNTAENLKYYTKPYEGYRTIRKSSIICLSDTSKGKLNHLAYRENFLNFEAITLCIFHKQDGKNMKWNVFPPADVIILSEKCAFHPELVRKNIPGATIVESCPPVKEKEVNKIQLLASDDKKTLNTTIGGAVQITIRQKTAAYEDRLIAAYFNH